MGFHDRRWRRLAAVLCLLAPAVGGAASGAPGEGGPGPPVVEFRGKVRDIEEGLRVIRLLGEGGDRREFVIGPRTVICGPGRRRIGIEDLKINDEVRIRFRPGPEPDVRRLDVLE